MALASRLNLRLQKEIKLLLTDPPPGASFPSLADGSSASSLTSIDALLQGPEGSVYANGLFKIKIQIPERYPFQPAVVTFATPIYHPNIDTGGRICLDILNLPPKGSWQPSLNISTVLTSIGLLLSEPNPDDGLMHEASREYKYNRQAFDQNARSMTEKYARARESEGTEDRHGSHSHSGPSTKHSDMQGPNASILVTEDMACHERSSGSSMKMSSKILESCSNTLEAPIHDCLMNDTGIQQLKANSISVEHAENPGNLLATRGKLSLKTSVVSHGRNGKHGSSDLANQCSSGLENRTIASNSRSLSPLVHVGGNYDGKGSKTFSGSSTGLSLKKTGLVGLKSSGAGVSPRLHLLKNKENLHSLQCLPHQQRDPPSAAYKRPGKQVVAEDLKQSQTATELLKKPRGQVLNCKSADAVVLNYDNASSCHPKSLLAENNTRSNDEQHLDHDFNKSSDKLSKCTEDTLNETTIVLDSEDSEDERVPVRSKLSLSKRNLTRKRKSSY